MFYKIIHIIIILLEIYKYYVTFTSRTSEEDILMNYKTMLFTSKLEEIGQVCSIAFYD